MFSYAIYGICIHSEIEIPGLPVGGGIPDLTICREPLQRWTPPRPVEGRECVYGAIAPDLIFWIYDGAEIYLNKFTTLDAASVRTYLLGLIISAALRQRGLLVLHASCVVKDGRAIGFVGDCGWGKSTLASYFHSCGWEMFNDDVMAIEVPYEGSPIAHPGSTHVRLRKDAGSWLHDDYDDLERVYPESSKRLQIVDSATSNEAVPLEKLYLLEPRAASENALVDVRGTEAIKALVQHTRVRNLFSSEEHMKMLFQQCSKVVKSIPVMMLKRKKGLSHLPEIHEVVSQDVRETTHFCRSSEAA